MLLFCRGLSLSLCIKANHSASPSHHGHVDALVSKVIEAISWAMKASCHDRSMCGGDCCWAHVK